MDADYWITELGRLYKRSTEAIEEDYEAAVEPLTEEFNTALKELTQEFPDNEIISGMMSIKTRDVYKTEPNDSGVRWEALHEVRSACEKIANALNYELPESQSTNTAADQMMMVSLESNQKNTQEVNQEVSLDSIIQLIDTDPQVQRDKEELKRLVEEFEEELDAENPDSSVLRQFIGEAKDYSTGVAAKMAIRAIQTGVVGVLAL
jgi:hypothetical protein